MLYSHKLTSNTSFKNNFNEGIENHKSEEIEGFNDSMTSIELKKLYLSDELSARKRGALYGKIKELEYSEYINKVLTETGKISNFFYENGSKANRLIPQDFYLSITKNESGGRCYPLVRAMAVALAKNGQEGADNLINKLYIAAANPGDRDSFLLKEGLKNLHSNTGAIEASYAYGQIILKDIKALLNTRDETMMFAINTQNHSMLIGKKILEGNKKYYFYDPNFGVFSFNDSSSLFSAVKKFFIEKQFAPYYSSFEKNNKPAFNVVYIDTDKMAIVPVGNNIVVDNLNGADSLSMAGKVQTNVDKILKIQHEAYEDTQLKRSLMVLDTEQWANKICEATFKLSSDHQLNGKWLPLFHNIEDDNNGHYRIQLLSVDNPELMRWVETTDKTFVDLTNKIYKK